jgi:uncharacterized membrane protein YvbJ
LNPVFVDSDRNSVFRPNMEKKFKVVIACMSAALLVGIAATGPVYASGKTFLSKKTGQSVENREAIHEAIENNDYNKWKELATHCPFAQKVNAENFAQFAEAHRLRMEQKFNGELPRGLAKENMKNRGMGKYMQNGTRACENK